MGCNTSQELNTQKLENDFIECEEKNDKEQKLYTPNVGDSADDGRNVPSDENISPNCMIPSKTPVMKTEYSAKNNAIYQQNEPILGLEIATKAIHNNIASIDELNDDNLNSFSSSGNSHIDQYENSENNAATKIQSTFRGYQVRTNMKKSTDTSVLAAAATSNKNAVDNNSKGTVAAVMAENVDPTKEELDAEFDPNDKELCDAALKIQATFRGHLSRKLAGNKDADDVDIQEITKKVAEELDIDLSDPELNKAATKIQASFRGHKSRRDLPAN